MIRSTVSHKHWCRSCNRIWIHMIPDDWICRNHRAKRGNRPSDMECVACSMLPGQTDGGAGNGKAKPQPPPRPAPGYPSDPVASLIAELIKNALRKL